MVVDLTTIHHEGGGAPANTPDEAARISHGGYCYAIGTFGWTRFRAPADGWATLNYNGQDLTICYTGDRHTGYPITDADIAATHAAYMDCHARGEVTDAPLVRAHRDSPGSATACPGDLTMERWTDVAGAVNVGAAAPPLPEEDEMLLQSAVAVNADGRPEQFSLNTDGTIWTRYRELTGGAWTAWQQFAAGPFDGGLSAWTNKRAGEDTLEICAHHATRGYLHRWQTQPNNGWSDWTDF